MQEVNIFDVVDYETTKDYFKFATVGDKVQGTFVARNDNSVDGYKNPQTLVDLLQSDGTVKTVSVRHNKVGLLEELDKCSLGQIIGFVFTGTKDNPGKQPTKFIRLVHDAKYVDEAWTAENAKAEEKAANPTAEVTVAQIFPDAPVAPVATPAPAAPISIEAALGATAAPAMSDADKIKFIAELAKTKLGANGVEEIKAKILEKTGIEFSTPNLDIVLAKMQELA